MQPFLKSVSPLYFETLYRDNPDPWHYETSAYEIEKYAETIAALPNSCYRSGLEIGGSIGVLTEKLAPKCEALLSIDVSPSAQLKAKHRCQHLPQVSFQVLQVPAQFPEQQFDLVLFSEVGYYLSWTDLYTVRQQIIAHLQPQGHLLLVHWLSKADDFCLTGEQVHECFLELCPAQFTHIYSKRQSEYQIDILERNC